MQSAALIKQAIASQGKANLSFTGKSMQPTLREPMMVTIVKTSAADIRKSDIIVYEQNNQLVSHRVIGIIRNSGNTLFITKGDNQPFGGVSEIPQENLVGKITHAFYADKPESDILINKHSFSYLILGRLYLFYRKNIRRFLPEFLRIFLKKLVKGLYVVVNGGNM